MVRPPMHAEIRQALLDDIEHGVFGEGELLTPETGLAARFGVSRPTVRQAILDLVREGVLARRRGHGTVVLRRRIGYPAGRLLSFSEEFAASGMETSARVVGQEVAPAGDVLAARLGVAAGTPVFGLERVRLVDGEPVAWQRSHMVESLVPGIDRLDFGTASLYATLRERYRLEVVGAEEVIRAGLADGRDAGLLGVAAAAPVFRIERRATSAVGGLLELVDSVYRADRYEIRLMLRR